MIDLSGKWKVSAGCQTGEVMLPGIIQMQGFGEKPNKDSIWYSGLHNPFWYEREEYSYKQEEELRASFLCQPERLFRGLAEYEREFVVTEACEYYAFIELTRWKVEAFIDGEFIGEDYSLCAPFEMKLGNLTAGTHTIKIKCDNSLIFPYRPDGHGVSDALGAGWNGMGGKIQLLTNKEYEQIEADKKQYAKNHPVNIFVNNGRFYINNKAKYLRGTHFGGDFPLTGIPETSPEYWDGLMSKIKSLGFNFIRCHSFCPPDIAFTMADKHELYLQPECGMWNVFNPGIEMIKVLEHETEKILKAFGHHPSFVFLSSTNEPDGNWYDVLKNWTEYARGVDARLGYQGRRLYTAQSGWFYDVPPKDIEGTDYLFFHRSAYGPLSGGTIRNVSGWRGKDYNPSLEDSALPAICHEMGQWCAYPDFGVIEKYTGYQKPSNYILWKKNAESNGVLGLNQEFTFCSGRNQLRFLKEEIEANYRTDHLYGYEYLDVHDYSGQGGAMVGLLDSFWDNKGYFTKEELRELVSDTVILTRIKSYVLKNTERLTTLVYILNFSDSSIKDGRISWKLEFDGKVTAAGVMDFSDVPNGVTATVGQIDIDLSSVYHSSLGSLRCELYDGKRLINTNHWDITVFAEKPIEACDVVYTHDEELAFISAREGKRVIYSPYMSDLDYSCPSYGMRNVFWNAQMGPNWGRQLGLVVDADHEALDGFPTEHSGGWMWEEVLQKARGFKLNPKYQSIVRCIDDWNRNNPMSLIFETKVGKGSMLIVSADIDGSFEERPACYGLRQSLMEYAASKEFEPSNEIPEEEIRKHIRSVYISGNFVKEIQVSNEADTSNLYEPNPCLTFKSGEVDLPYEIKYILTEKKKIKGLYYLPPQGERYFEGCVKTLTVASGSGSDRIKRKTVTLKNYLLGELIEFEPFEAEEITICIESVYGVGEKTSWKEDESGWHMEKVMFKPQVSVGSFELIYDESCDLPELHNNAPFWNKRDRIRHKEIDTN